ncbi:D-glycero-beta-D-manno-heptose 1,7-bisphosphate 7-phosphatase [Parathalassolituus penaei]|uniref:D,D-heptose 1,7-bisphosphate phosphatase n=1 Tax=Parathalassolituus penaei TaxID=2997323 RepID=A0A9X3ECW9_9GAMM|nr:D-glycero-beta-D-manno-heptose 1,7-bisphosphate 7-phosphatase [Parathalassolituus penaei]MCY0965267.1 D-glycero-beta-D-manno-heptose 1,7-bisphosphate 7-phosphatase [Parathalassolituus penaei]
MDSRPLIILDRDGVLNLDSDAYVKSVDEWIPIPGSAEAVARLCKAGYQVAVATNQSGLARGYFSQADLDAMHTKMTALVNAAGGEFAHIAWCPHGPDDSCDCRKPLPGLIHQIERVLGVSAAGGWMVGDSIRDLEAGVAAGCKPVLVRTGKGEASVAKLARYPQLATAEVYNDLASWVDQLLESVK